MNHNNFLKALKNYLKKKITKHEIETTFYGLGYNAACKDILEKINDQIKEIKKAERSEKT